MSDEANGTVGVMEMIKARRKLGLCRRCPTKLPEPRKVDLCAVCGSKAKKRAAARLSEPPTFESWERKEGNRGR